MSQPKVSVIIPVYNVESYLKRCMDSVLGQTLKEIEIILVNDGSKDNCPRLCDEYAAQDARIKVIHKENAGLGYARNSGLEAATGEYIAFLDSDDYMHLEKLEAMYSAAKREQADTCISGFWRMRGDTVVREYCGKLKGLYRGDAALSVIYMNILGSAPCEPDDFLILWQSSCLTLYSHAIIREHGLRFVSEREFLSEDILFNMDYFHLAQSVYVIDKPYQYYCENDQSLSQTFRPDRCARQIHMYREQLKRIAGESFYEDAKQRVQRTLLMKIRSSIIQMCNQPQALEKIKSTCDLPELQEVLREYPWRQMPMKARIFNFGMRYRLSPLLYLLVKVKTCPLNRENGAMRTRAGTPRKN